MVICVVRTMDTGTSPSIAILLEHQNASPLVKTSVAVVAQRVCAALQQINKTRGGSGKTKPQTTRHQPYHNNCASGLLAMCCAQLQAQHALHTCCADSTRVVAKAFGRTLEMQTASATACVQVGWEHCVNTLALSQAVAATKGTANQNAT